MTLSDGVVLLRPLNISDAQAHLAGEDDALVQWLNGGKASIDTVTGHIERAEEAWARSADWRAFAITEAATSCLAGTIDVHAALPTLRGGVVNLAYGIYPQWRGRGFAARAVLLAAGYAAERLEASVSVLRIHPENTRSVAVARRCHYRDVGAVRTEEGLLAHYVRYVRPEP